MMISRSLRVSFALAAALLLFGAALAPVAAQDPYKDDPKIPDTPACKRALELIDLVNKGDQDKARAYILENFTPEFRDMTPMEEHLRTFYAIRAQSDGYDTHSARIYDPARPATNATIIVRNRLSEAWEAFVVDVEEAAPHRIASLRVAPARAPTDIAPEKPLSEAEIAKQLGAYIDRLAARDLFSGTVLLAKDGKPFFTKAVGIANRDFMAPVRLDTKFNTGSMFKMLTAVAIAQLAEGGNSPSTTRSGSSSEPIGSRSRFWIRSRSSSSSRTPPGLGSYFNETYDRTLEASLPEGRGLQAARHQRHPRLRARDEVAVQQHGIPAARRHRRKGERGGLLRLYPGPRDGPRRDEEHRLLRARPRESESRDRLRQGAGAEWRRLSQQHLPARPARRPRWRRLYDRRGSPRLRRRAAGRQARLEGNARKAVAGVPRKELAAVRLRLRRFSVTDRPRRRPQRRFRRHQRRAR